VPAWLIERCKRGDEEAWTQLVDATYKDVYTLCLRILRNTEDASDATQDAYLKVYRGLRSFRGESLFSTWLYRVATNAAISRQRARARRRAHETKGDEEVLNRLPAPTSTEAQAGARLDLVDLERALAELPEHYRAAVVLRDVYGMGIEEIAAQLKVSESAAKVRVHRGRKKLREAMFEPATQEDHDEV
jgi:RNA polymerase sigma-70 factor (ECF subfamily)